MKTRQEQKWDANHLYELFLSEIRHARINGTVSVLFKTRLIFPRINGPIVIVIWWWWWYDAEVLSDSEEDSGGSSDEYEDEDDDEDDDDDDEDDEDEDDDDDDDDEDDEDDDGKNDEDSNGQTMPGQAKRKVSKKMLVRVSKARENDELS